MDVPLLLQEVLSNLTQLDVSVFDPSQEHHGPCEWDFHAQVGDNLFLIKYKSRASSEAVGAALQHFEFCKNHDLSEADVLLAVPYMGDVGKKMCARARVNWLDLSGNASLRAPGLHVNVSGQSNRFPKRGRPPNLFAPKAARLVRSMLLHPSRSWEQQDLVSETDLSKGYVSKLLRRLIRAGFVDQDAGLHRVLDRNRLLDAWREAYDFHDHAIRRAVIPTRTPQMLTERLVADLVSEGISTAVTGMGAAWFYARFAAYRLATVYVSRMPSTDQFERMGARLVDSGENVWIVQPNDEGVFTGSQSEEGITYVGALQAYLDLKGHFERAEEAAEALRPLVFKGDLHAS